MPTPLVVHIEWNKFAAVVADKEPSKVGGHMVRLQVETIAVKVEKGPSKAADAKVVKAEKLVACLGHTDCWKSIRPHHVRQLLQPCRP